MRPTDEHSLARHGFCANRKLRITLDGQPVSGFAYNKARALLAYLAVEADCPHHRDVLVGLQWPELPDTAARTNLRQALANLREAIGDATATPPFLHITRDTIQFNPASDYDLDVAAFTALLAACESHTHRRLERCRSCAARMKQTISHYRGDFLAEFSVGDSAPFEEWQLRHRERFHQRALATLAHLADYRERRGDDEPARCYAQRQIELEPWREEAHRQLMRLLARGNQRSGALAQYETCRRILARDLGVEPEAEATALYERIRHSTSSELRVLSAEIRAQGGETQTSNLKPQNIQNFPAQATPLIGRETELAELGALLENPAHRLITIVGPGGVGKTRLALAAATEETEVFTDGGAFVPLAAIRAAAFVAPAILAALDVPLQGQRDPREQLLDYLHEKELLPVLDNFEQLLAPDQSDNDGITELVSEILAHAPDVTLLITWRERLALPGEWLFDLSGLSYPAGDPSDGIEGYSAVELFVQRASQVRRQFALADGEVRAVARICRLIEGLPLAIELAAAALRTHSCAAIADAIETSLSALTSRLRAIPERHRSIWATFEHSWRLLSEEERQVLARLSVFRGGFEEEAAAQVARASPQLLAALVDKSLLRWDGVARYDMHELVRQYAGAKLEQVGKARSIRNHHVAYYLALAETAEPLLSTSDQRVWLDRLEQDHDNLRAALAWAVDHNPDGALRLSGALADFWLLRGHLSQGRQWIERALAGADARARAGADPDHSAGASPHATAARAKALHGAGRIGHVQEDNVRAEELFVESLTLTRALGDPRRVALLLNDLGELVLQRGDSVQAMTLYTEGLTLARARLDEARFAATWATGRAMTLDQAIAYALDLSDAAPERPSRAD